MNSVLLVEPRNTEYCFILLKRCIEVLGTDNWDFVFYCGNHSSEYYNNLLNSKYPELKNRIKLIKLPVSNFNTCHEYSDFMKSRKLWESLTGTFVLTIQIDAWVISEGKYTIDYFINKNKSFIGGNMSYPWNELHREKIYRPFLNFNGGMSLRKREDMINIIDTFPPEKTLQGSQKINTDAEDVYFVLGCYKLGLTLGDTQDDSCFCIHTIQKPEAFGVHQSSFPFDKRIHDYNVILHLNRTLV